MELQGKLVSIQEEKQVSDKFKKREFWVEVGGERPQTLNLEFVQGYTEKLDEFNVGEKVDVKFNLMGRVYKDKCFNSLQAYSIELGAGQVRKAAVQEDDGSLPF